MFSVAGAGGSGNTTNGAGPAGVRPSAAAGNISTASSSSGPLPNSGYSVYPPQPYASQTQAPPPQGFALGMMNSGMSKSGNNSIASGPAGVAGASSNTLPSPSLKASSKMEGNAGPAGNTNTANRKRGASTSSNVTGNEGKDKKARQGPSEHSAAANGSAADGRTWGEEANK